MINDRNKPLRPGSELYSVYPVFENDTRAYKIRKYEIIDMFYSDNFYLRVIDDRGIRYQFVTGDFSDFYYTFEEAELARKRNEKTIGYASWAYNKVPYQDYEKAEEI